MSAIASKTLTCFVAFKGMTLVSIQHCLAPQQRFLPPSFSLREKNQGRRSRKSCKAIGRRGFYAKLEMLNPEDFDVGKLIGTYGFMNITSYAARTTGGMPFASFSEKSGAGLSEKDIERLQSQDVGEGDVEIRLYSGRISQGPMSGRSVIFKAYPGRVIGGEMADALATNELATHGYIQDFGDKERCKNIQMLLGGFETSTGEQWLVFQDNGRLTASNYAKIASKATTENSIVGGTTIWDMFDVTPTIKRRQEFIIKLLQGVFSGLAYLHMHDRLHQSLGPASVVLNTIKERNMIHLEPRLCDLAFSVDLSKYPCFPSAKGISSTPSVDSGLDKVVATFSEGLWRRAASAGAFTPYEKRAFGIADDIYAAGLFFAYMVFIPLCQAGSMDGPTLQRLVESTFQLDIKAMREYCQADNRWSEAVKFLDLREKAGWELLEAMLHADYRLRPTAASVLNHRFMTGDLT